MRAYVLMNKDGKFFGPGGWLGDIREATPFPAADVLKMMKALKGCKACAVAVNIAYMPENLPASPMFESFSRAAA
jgi:hypothetical protein